MSNNFLSIVLSKSFETVGRTLIGLRIALVLLGQFFGRDVTSAHLSSFGNDNCSMQLLEI